MWSDEFPDMTDMPALPEGFEDTSWHNDICPSYTSDKLGLSIFIDYPKVEDREFGGEAKRFSVHRQKAGLPFGVWYSETDDWDVMLEVIEATRIATKWVHILGLGFHPDTRGASYVAERIDEPLFNDVQAKEYDDDMERLFTLAGDPYEYCIRAWKTADLIEEEKELEDATV